MRNRRGRSKISTTLIPEAGGESEGDENRDKESDNKEGFFACYLLTSLSPRHKGHSYIGFTVNPRRRIRQHNGEIGSGAWRTKKKRPWEMVLCIYGFPTNVSALQFEWAWQHPRESLAVRQAAATFKSLSGTANKIKLAYTMLTLPAWQSLDITMNFFSTKYKQHSAGCPSLPEHMKVRVCPMDELPCYNETNYENLYGNYDEYDADDDCLMDELPDNAEGNQSLCRNKDIWDDEECDETSLDATDHNLADCQDGIGKAANELHWQTEEFCETQPRDSATPGIACRHMSEFIDSRLITSISAIAAPPSNADKSAKDGDNFSLREESSVELGWPTAIDADKVQLSRNSSIVYQEAEFIDISTPSPLCRISSCGKKKRRRLLNCSEIIDLTKSPIFVQL